MKHTIFLILTLTGLFVKSQNIQVDSGSFTPQELIENVLIDSDCISNVNVTNVVGGNFGGTDQSYGYFDATGTDFPFQNGIVLSTGRLQNVPGPNTNLSDDDASNWEGDIDLEIALNEANTTNATILEFDFSSNSASQVSFRYLFASEEYQAGNSNTCNFSDLFGFLIQPADGSQAYENIAVVPGTSTPVKVTTVTPGIPGSCPPLNDVYFGSFNGSNSPINFNGQTAVLTAIANVVPNQLYHVKLVIADEQNFRFDSAVFLEAASFQLSTDLGSDRLLANNNALCEGETLELNINTPNINPSYNWYRDGILVQSTPLGCLNCGIFNITEPGNYTVEVGYNNGCISTGQINIEYAPIPQSENITLTSCDTNTDGFSIFNLNNATNQIIGNNNNLTLDNFFLSEENAIDNENPIENNVSFENSIVSQIVYARVSNSANCISIAAITLETSNIELDIPNLIACDDDFDGFTTFDLSQIQSSIIVQIPTSATVTYFETELDALNDTNALSSNYNNTTANTQTIFAKIESNNQCYSISEVTLNVISPPTLMQDETIFYCDNQFPETIDISGGVIGDLPNNFYYEWFFNGNITDTNTINNSINQPGTYTVNVINTEGCSSSRTITVLPSSVAEITAISITGIYPNNTIELSVSGNGDYEYSIGSTDNFQDSSSFTNIPEGFQTVYINDKNGCGITTQEISILGFPRFFTPNGDDVNDSWIISGHNPQFSEINSVKIFNRFGKLLANLSPNQLFWDGIYNGKPLNTSDYWYVVSFNSGLTYKGHFTLKY